MDGRRDTAEHLKAYCVEVCPSFSIIFPGNEKANLQKASRWWAQRSTTMKLKQSSRRLGTLVSTTSDVTCRLNFKALKGRGHKRSAWVTAIYPDLRSEFARLRAAGLKFSASVLRTHAIMMIDEAPPNSQYHRSVRHNGTPLRDKISIRWIQHFMHSQKSSYVTGKLLVSTAKQVQIEREVAYYLGVLNRSFDAGVLHEHLIENSDETHFIFNMDNGKTLGFKGDQNVKYADVLSGGEPITMMVRISGGKDAVVHPLFLILKNKKRSYPIRGVDDNVPGVYYCTSPKGWMDSNLWLSWLSEPRVIKSLPFRQQRTLFVDNCSSHVSNEVVFEELQGIKTTVKKLPPNAAHLLQPADSFIVQKIKDTWKTRWDEYKYSCVKSEEWLDEEKGTASGKLKNPGKAFCLKLAAAAVRDVNALRDKSGVHYARKAMIMTGKSLNLNGRWEEGPLTDELQAIIAKHRVHFDGEPVLVVDVETESEAE